MCALSQPVGAGSLDVCTGHRAKERQGLGCCAVSWDGLPPTHTHTSGPTRAIHCPHGRQPTATARRAQASARGHEGAPGYGAGSALMRADAEKLLRRLVLGGVLREETSRQEQYQSIVSVIRVNKVGGLGALGGILGRGGRTCMAGAVWMRLHRGRGRRQQGGSGARAQERVPIDRGGRVGRAGATLHPLRHTHPTRPSDRARRAAVGGGCQGADGAAAR